MYAISCVCGVLCVVWYVWCGVCGVVCVVLYVWCVVRCGLFDVLCGVCAVSGCMNATSFLTC